MSFVSGSRGLEIKTDGTRVLAMKFSQITDLFASHTHRIITPQMDLFD